MKKLTVRTVPVDTQHIGKINYLDIKSRKLKHDENLYRVQYRIKAEWRIIMREIDKRLI